MANDINVISIERVLPNENNGEPVKSTTLNYRHNFTVQNKDALAGVGLVLLQFVSMAWRSTPPAEDATIAAQYLNARVIAEDTYFVDETVASNEAIRRQALRGVFRSWYIISAQLGIEMVEAIQELSVVTVQVPMYGLENGRDGIVVRIQYDTSSGVGKYMVYI